VKTSRAFRSVPTLRDDCFDKWCIVEMGGPEGNGFDVPRQALAKLRKLGK